MLTRLVGFAHYQSGEPCMGAQFKGGDIPERN